MFKLSKYEGMLNTTDLFNLRSWDTWNKTEKSEIKTNIIEKISNPSLTYRIFAMVTAFAIGQQIWDDYEDFQFDYATAIFAGICGQYLFSWAENIIKPHFYYSDTEEAIWETMIGISIWGFIQQMGMEEQLKMNGKKSLTIFNIYMTLVYGIPLVSRHFLSKDFDLKYIP